MGRKQIDLTNRVVGDLVVLYKLPGSYPVGCTPWMCECSCGNKIPVKSRSLLGEDRKSCGCLLPRKNNEKSFIDITGKKFGALTVVKVTHYKSKKGEFKWECKCDCGLSKLVIGSKLRSGAVVSCGCKILYRKNIPTGSKSRNWKGYEEISMTQFNRLQLNASRRGISFNITIQDIWDKYIAQGRKCAYTDIPVEFKYRRSNRCLTTASVDRIDSNKGYTKDNIQIVHKDINQIKLDLDEIKFLTYCNLVAKKRPIILT